MTQNYELLTGPFAGSVMEEGCCILDVEWDELPVDLGLRATEWSIYNKVGFEDKQALLKAWECSWDTHPTYKGVTLRPMSEWETID